MKFCYNCFSDSEIKKIIETGHQKGICPICGANDTYIYDSDNDNIIQQNFENLLNIYSFENELDDNSNVELFSISEDIINNWNIFNDALNYEQKYQILEELCKKNIAEKKDFLSAKAGIAEKNDNTYLETHAIVRSGNWDEFLRSIKYTNRFHSSGINLEKLSYFCSYTEKIYKKGSKFYRSRIAIDKNGFQKDKMGSPPKGYASAGRANAEGISRLYLSNDECTTIHEIRAGAFDYVTIGTFVAKENFSVVNFRNINNISPFSGDMDVLEYAINREYLQHIDIEISKMLSPSERNIDYVPTQYIVDFLQRTNVYDGVEYKSTLNPGGYNLALFSGEKFECTEVKTVRIDKLEYNWK